MSKVEIVAQDGTRLGEIDETAETIVLTEDGQARMLPGKKRRRTAASPAVSGHETTGR